MKEHENLLMKVNLNTCLCHLCIDSIKQVRVFKRTGNGQYEEKKGLYGCEQYTQLSHLRGLDYECANGCIHKISIVQIIKTYK